MSNQISPSSGAQLGTDEDCSFGLVDHRVAFMDGMDALFSNPDFSDVTFVVKEERFHVHKIILATRSEYFRTMLYGGLKESTQAEIFLKETDPIAFRTLLRYIYTAKVDLSGFAVNELMTILQLAHEYMLTEIEKALASHTKTKLDTDNVFAVIRTSTLLSVDDLTEHCMHYCDRHAPQILAAQEFLGLPLEVVMEMLSRDSFCVAEIDVFYAVTKWIQARRFAENTDVGMLIERFIADDCLRLPLISQKELLSAVRGAMAFATISSVLDKHILNAIQLKDSGSYSRFRGRLLPNENIATIDLGAKFVAGGDSQMLHRGSRKDTSWGSVEATGQGSSIRSSRENSTRMRETILQLGQPYTINCIVLERQDYYGNRSCYRLHCHFELSMNCRDWTSVAVPTTFRNNYLTLIFDARLVRYIRLSGGSDSGSPLNVRLQALYSSKKFNSDSKAIVVESSDAPSM